MRDREQILDSTVKRGPSFKSLEETILNFKQSKPQDTYTDEQWIKLNNQRMLLEARIQI